MNHSAITLEGHKCTCTFKPQEFKINWEASTVKRSACMVSTDEIVLQHYETIILRIDRTKGKITLMKDGISVSSSRAINQVLDYFSYPSIKELRLKRNQDYVNLRELNFSS